MGELLREYPRIVLEKKFLSEAEVLHLINQAEGKYQRSTVVDNLSGESVVDEYRTGEFCHLGQSPDAMTRAIEERIAAVTGTKLAQGEAIQIVKYKTGDQYKPHFDWFDPSLPNSNKQLKFGGQRIATVILYLQMPEEGGETEFPDVTPKVSVKPEPGDALFFWNLDKQGKGERLATHAGRPPVKGEKIIATRWLRERATDGSEEKDALVAKSLEKSKLTEAKAAAAKAQKELEEASKAEKAAREQRCYDRMMVVLREERCKMYAMPHTMVAQDGSLKIAATVELEAQDSEPSQEPPK